MSFVKALPNRCPWLSRNRDNFSRSFGDEALASLREQLLRLSRRERPTPIPRAAASDILAFSMANSRGTGGQNSGTRGQNLGMRGQFTAERVTNSRGIEWPLRAEYALAAIGSCIMVMSF